LRLTVKFAVPEVVRNKALVAGADRWLEQLPSLVAELERDWSITVGRTYIGGTEAFVAEATLADGSEAVLKLLIPRDGDGARNEIEALRLTRGEGCVQLKKFDLERCALLLERLGPSLADLKRPLAQRHEILCGGAQRVWRPAADRGFPTGAWKGQWLIDFITTAWQRLDRPCSERAVDYALACATRRIAAHDDERAVLVHGDIHQWNALEAKEGFKLVDPDGLLAEPEYDLGILMREDPVELLDGDPRKRAGWLGKRTELDPIAIWEWGVIERVSTGLICIEIDLNPIGRQMLFAADRVSED
jgi:streptomycin 6-kinase